MNWSSEDDEFLIDFVRVHEMLYNIKDKDYRQTQMKQKLWREVGEVINKTGPDCYKRWCYVREYYIRRIGKPGTGSSGEAAKKRSDLLSFLDSIPSSQRKGITNVITNDNPIECTPTQDTSEQSPFQTQEMENILTLINEEDKNEYSKESSKNDEDINKEFKGDGIKNRNRKNSSHSQEGLNLLKQIVQRNPSTPNELDETDLFFSSMAKIVKKLPRYEQTQLRMQIGSLVGNAELRCIPIDSPTNSVSPSGTSGSDYLEVATPSPRPSSIAANYSEVGIPSPIMNTIAGAVPVGPINRTISINEQGQIYLLSEDNI